MLRNIGNQVAQEQLAVSLRVMADALGRIVVLLTCIFVWAGLVASSAGQIADSNEWIIKGDEHRVLDRFRDSFGWPDPSMPTGQATLYVYSSGPTYSVVAVGPIASDAKEYARKIEKWKNRRGLKGTVLYSQEDDCAAAKYVVSIAQFGKRGYTLDIPLDSLFSEVQLEKVTHYGFTTRGPVKVPSDLPKPDYVTSRGNRYWNVSEWDEKRDVLVSDQLSWWSAPLLIGSAIFPIVASSGIFLGALYVARRKQIGLDKRRAMYAGVMTKGNIWVLGIHSLIIFPSIFIRALDPICELWFGTPFFTVGILLVLGLNFIPMTFLPFLLREEAKLGDLTAEEIASLPPTLPPKSESPSTSKPNGLSFSTMKAKAPGLITFVLAAAIIFYPTTKTNPFHNFKTILGMLVLLSPTLFLLKYKFEPKPASSDDLSALEEKANTLLASLQSRNKVNVESVEVHASGQTDLFCMLIGKKLYISEASMRIMSIEELEFYALAKLWSPPVEPWHDKSFYVLMIPLCALSILLLFAEVLSPDLIAYRLIGVFLPTLGFVISFVFRQRMLIRKAFENDLSIIRETNNPTAATSSLQNLLRMSEIGMGRYGAKEKPTYSERIARIRAAFPETPSDPASE